MLPGPVSSGARSSPQLVDDMDGRRRRRGDAQLADDVLIAPEPIVGMLQVDAERVLSELLGSGSESSSRIEVPTNSQRRGARVVRHYLRESEGEGYWDFFKPRQGLMVSVTDASYHRDTWVRVEGDGLFKLRILLSGRLRSGSGEILAQAPETLLYVSPGASSEGYYAALDEPLRMIVLHCRPELLTRVLGLGPAEIPAPLDSLYVPGRPTSCQRLALRPGAIHAAQRILDSPHRLSPTLRHRYLETLSTEILLEVLGELQNRSLLRDKSPQLSPRDLSRVYEARDYLAQHYAHPPNIPELARLVGVNQTKLKSLFRDVLGVTIYGFIVRCRMERAAELLATGEHGIAQVAYAVGYDYPANFTAAFKRHSGQLPGSWKSSARGHEHRHR
ncbi:MAG TPA: AraC family transcriptional regulator [Steroidobacteraceae bacterium]|nr:AraC family transcriptional regulator [Steroidobacteraceae bacterium]